MSKTDAHDKKSSLDKFALTFEYDRTWGDAKKMLRQKTDRN